MKRGAALYNIGRGTTVDRTRSSPPALRQVGVAWLDVTEPEPLAARSSLVAEPNCFITPHVAGGHAERRKRSSAISSRTSAASWRGPAGGSYFLDGV